MSSRGWLVGAAVAAAVVCPALIGPAALMTLFLASSSATACTPGAAVAPVVAAGDWVSPLAGPLTSNYGMRFHPVRHRWSLHDGQDIGAPAGTEVHAAAGGRVSVRDTAWGGPHTVTIDHGGGIQTVYGHMQSASVVTGQLVTAGEVIGAVGSMGYSTGNHLHVSVWRNGSTVDPVPFFADQGVQLGSPPAVSLPAVAASTTPTGTASPQTSALPGSWSATSATGEQVTLDSVQLGFAATFVTKGEQLGVPREGIVIALMVPFVESGWRNLASTVYPVTNGLEYPRGASGSDHDSVGLTQARPAAGWGTPQQIMDPAYAAAAFFGGTHGPNSGNPRGLLDIPGWQSMAPGDAAQAVQVSAFPDRYAAWTDAAGALLDLVRGHVDPASVAQAGCAAMVTADGGFVMATFNVLGATHTTADGDLPSWPSGQQRMTEQLANLVAAGVSVAGLQEVAHDQWDVIKADPQWQVYPAERRKTQNSLIWQPSQWELVSAEQFTVPYFHGDDAAQSLVRLRQVSSGQLMIFVNVHNPADVHGPAGRWRAAALKLEAELIEELKAARVPIFLTGDFNDVDPPYCKLTGSMLSAFGVGDTSPCRAPAPAGIDQIFGWGDLSFAATTVDASTIDKHLSDHPMVTTQVQATDPDPGVLASATADPGGTVTAVTGDLSLTYTSPPNPTPEQQALAYALAQVGKRYVLGATGPDAFDCSGLTQQSYRNAGITLPRLASEQINVGTRVGLTDLAPGDLLYYQSNSSPRSGHIAMYAGEGLVVEAANPRKGVRLRPMDDSWYVKRFVAATRVG